MQLGAITTMPNPTSRSPKSHSDHGRETDSAPDGSTRRAAKQAVQAWLFILAALSSTVVTASGPVPPEITSFSPLQHDELVDQFTGYFRYSAPFEDDLGP